MAEIAELRERKAWLDFLRGIAMLLVVWEHIAVDWVPMFAVTGPFKMPLFFAISAYVFNDKNGDILQFLEHLLYKMVIPWLLLSLVWLKPAYALFIGEPSRIPGYFYTLFSGKTLWFLPCMILAESVFFLVRKFIKQQNARHIALLALFVC